MFYSVACFNTSFMVDREMKFLNSTSSKIIALKESTRMRVIGVDWEDLSTHWYKNGKAFTPEDLASHLKMIVSKQRSRSIPIKPPVLLPAQNALPKLGTQAPDVADMAAFFLKPVTNLSSSKGVHDSRGRKLASATDILTYIIIQ